MLLPFSALVGRLLFSALNFTELLITWIYLWAHIMYVTLVLSFVGDMIGLMDSESMSGLTVTMILFMLLMFYFFGRTFRYLTGGHWIVIFLKVFVTIYAGIFAFFAMVW